MLSSRSRPVVEATLPAVAENIHEIAGRFYRHMFAARPDLLDGVFNRGNQAAGTQQVALAGSVAGFAAALVQDPGLVPERLMARIAHKHASLGIAPEQYGVVHEHLFWAIGDVLGDAVTPEVAQAWDEVYWLMAHALINQERGLYGATGVTPTTVWGTWRVESVTPSTPDVVELVVSRADGRWGRPSLPGQYVTVTMPMADGVHQPRQYSLTRADDGARRHFAVKRVHGGGTPDGEVSTALCTTVKVGDELTISAPFGDVVLDDSGRPVVLASAGIGITPTAGMLSHLVAAGATVPVTVLHADVDAGSFALRDQVVADVGALPGGRLHVWFERATGTPPATGLPAAAVHEGYMDLTDVDLPDGAVYYLCGPLPFMRAIRSSLLDRGVPARDVHYEVFGPDLWQADLQPDPAPSAPPPCR